MTEEKEPNYLVASLSIGCALGAMFGILTDNLALGISIGLALGAAAAYSIESESKKAE